MKVVHETGVRIATLSGAIVRLEPGVPVDLPEQLARLALAEGAERIRDDSRPETPKPEPAPLRVSSTESDLAPPRPTPATRHERLVAVMLDIIARGDVSDFRSDKTPKQAVVTRLFGEAVGEEERAAAWAEATTKA